MVLLLAIAGALAMPPGFHVTREGVSGCTLMLGTKEADGVVPMRAECHWPKVTVQKFDSVFKHWENHDLIFSAIASSDIVSTDGDVSEVKQVQVTRGISDRFIVLTGTHTALPDGGFRYSWTKSKHQLPVPAGDVAVARSDGFWEVHPAKDGGVDVIHQLSYDPGGSVPWFLVRWFQTSGLAGIVSDLHTYMTRPAAK